MVKVDGYVSKLWLEIRFKFKIKIEI